MGVKEAAAALDRLVPITSAAERVWVDVYYDLFDHPDAAGMANLLQERGLFALFETVPTHGGGLVRSSGKPLG